MSITTEIVRLQNCVSNAYTACNNKGATMPVTQNSDALPTTIQSISTSSSDPDIIPKYSLNYISGDYTTQDVSVVDVTNKFQDIDKISGGFQYVFNSVSNPKRHITGNINFANLKVVTGNMIWCFNNCEFDQNATVSFPLLEEITTLWDSTFSGTTNLATVTFGALKTITGRLSNTFSHGASHIGEAISSITFPSLQTIGPNASFVNAFGGSDITTMSFPSLTSIQNVDAFKWAFSLCDLLTEIHFKASMQSVVENLTQYSSAFGASNATIYFDL